MFSSTRWSLGLVATATSNSNNRLRPNGLSSKYVLSKRDNFTGKSVQFNDQQLAEFRRERLQNHSTLKISKLRSNIALPITNYSVGDLVHIKNEGSKHTGR